MKTFEDLTFERFQESDIELFTPMVKRANNNRYTLKEDINEFSP